MDRDLDAVTSDTFLDEILNKNAEVKVRKTTKPETIAEELKIVKAYILKHQETSGKKVERATGCSDSRVATAYKHLKNEKLFNKQDIYDKRDEYNLEYIEKHYRTMRRTDIAARLNVCVSKVTRIVLKNFDYDLICKTQYRKQKPEGKVGIINMREAINEYYWKCKSDIEFVKLAKKIGITVDRLHTAAEGYDIYRIEPIKKVKSQPYQFRESATEILKRKNY